jgi:hypothetical protein
MIVLLPMAGNHAARRIALAVAMNLKQKHVEIEALLLREQKLNAKRVVTILLQDQNPMNLAVRLLIGIAAVKATIILLTTTVVIIAALVAAIVVLLVAEAHLVADVEAEIKNNIGGIISH